MLIDSGSVHPYGSFWLDVLDKGIKAVAVCVGAGWTWMNFVKSRTYRPSLECSVSGELFRKDGADFAEMTFKLKNTGRTKYPLDEIGTSLEVDVLRKKGHVETLGIWIKNEPLLGEPVFAKHQWIEPGEEIEEPRILPVPNPRDFVALEVRMRIVSQGTEWNTTCFIREN